MSVERDIDKDLRQCEQAPFPLAYDHFGGGNSYTFTMREIEWVNMAREALPHYILALRSERERAEKAEAEVERLKADLMRRHSDAMDAYHALTTTPPNAARALSHVKACVTGSLLPSPTPDSTEGAK